MPEKSNRLFEVVCKGCGRVLVTVERLRDPEIAVLEDHLRVCCQSEPLPDRALLGELIARVRMTSVAR